MNDIRSRDTAISALRALPPEVHVQLVNEMMDDLGTDYGTWDLKSKMLLMTLSMLLMKHVDAESRVKFEEIIRTISGLRRRASTENFRDLPTDALRTEISDLMVQSIVDGVDDGNRQLIRERIEEYVDRVDADDDFLIMARRNLSKLRAED